MRINSIQHTHTLRAVTHTLHTFHASDCMLPIHAACSGGRCRGLCVWVGLGEKEEGGRRAMVRKSMQRRELSSATAGASCGG